MKNALPLLLLLAASACSTVRLTPSATDSTRVEVRTEIRTVHDTAYVELPIIMERVATLDTASVLENAYARSEASVSDGILRHSLETKPASVPVRVETREVVRDSVVYRDRVQVRTVEVERRLTLWQSLKMRLGGIAIILITIAIVYFMFNLLNLLKP